MKKSVADPGFNFNELRSLRLQGFGALRIGIGQFHFQDSVESPVMIPSSHRRWRCDRELDLQLRNKSPKRRVKAKLRDDRRPATRVNEIWAMDFVHDQLATGGKLRVLTIVDIFSHFSPALEPRLTFRGTDVVEVLGKGLPMKLEPATIRVGQGSPPT